MKTYIFKQEVRSTLVEYEYLTITVEQMRKILKESSYDCDNVDLLDDDETPLAFCAALETGCIEWEPDRIEEWDKDSYWASDIDYTSVK